MLRLIFSIIRLQVSGEEETSCGEQARRSTCKGLPHPPRSSSPAEPGKSGCGTLMARLVVLTDDLVARLITGTWPEKEAIHEGSMGLAALCGSSFD